MISAVPFRSFALGASIILAAGTTAEARSHASHGSTGASSFARHGTVISFSTAHSHGRFGTRYAGYGRRGGGIQCVTFARADTGIELTGNASAWWDNAEGMYERGTRPEAGSVLSFRANGAMRLGHVAVVDQVVNSRLIEIDQANWGNGGSVTRAVSVVDVSPRNDWTAVRVALGHTGDYGSIYPTHGFIYNRPDSGRLVTADNSPAPLPALNPAPRDLRGYGRYAEADDEVAEAPDGAEPIGGFRHSSWGHQHHHYVAAAYHHHGRPATRHGRA